MTDVYDALEDLKRAEAEQASFVSDEQRLANQVAEAEVRVDAAKRENRDREFSTLQNSAYEVVKVLEGHFDDLRQAFNSYDLPAALKSFEHAMTAWKTLTDINLQAIALNRSLSNRLEWGITPGAMIIACIAGTSGDDAQIKQGMAYALQRELVTSIPRNFNAKEWTRLWATRQFVHRRQY
jgi:hypothetical protein